MKNILSHVIVTSIILFATTTHGQTVYDEYQDGKIWLKINDQYRINASIGEDPLNLAFQTLPVIEQLKAVYGVTKLSRPFYRVTDSPELSKTYLVEFANINQVMDFISDLETSGKVDYAERVPLDRPCLTPNDPSYSSQWHLSKIKASLAWNSFSTGSNVVVAIVDDAIERTHADLSPNLWVNTGDNNTNGIDDDGNGYIDDINGFDVASNDNNPNPPNSNFDHGTHVAGISAAATNNSTGVASIGFSVKLMCVKATTQSTVITHGYDGIVYAALNGADVINISWGGTGYSTTAQNVVNWAYTTRGCILVAGAGNNGNSTQFYPAAYNNVVAVASTTSSDKRSSFSNYGTWIDISSPGSNIYSTKVNNSYGNKSGTSMASPLVAGLVGLMKSLNPSLTQNDIITCLKNSAVNIDGLNSGYSGKLGSGRIDADAAMQCISATLNYPPSADFTSNVTTVTAGGVVSFTDQSVYNPTSWTWTFQGGTPASFNGQTPPPITYNTPGVYTVSLVATNSNGSDSEVKTGYITVNTGGGCGAFNYPIPGSWTLGSYLAGTGGSDGFVNGVNTAGDKQKGMLFDASTSPYGYLTRVYVAFARAYSSNPNKLVTLRVYDGTSGTPGSQLGSVSVKVGDINAHAAGGYYTTFHFPNAVTLPTSKRFFATVDMSNFAWSGNPKDTLSIYSNIDGQTTPSAVWEQQSDNSWKRYSTTGSWPLNISLVMHPFVTDVPSNATFTQNATSVCQGSTVNFDANGSTYGDTLLWAFQGGSPSISSNVQQSIIYNTPGTYSVTLYVVGGGCHQIDSMVTTVEVKPNPNVNVGSTISTICPGANSTLTASGANSYVWSPSTGLNTSVGASVVASPTVSTTYNVTGTSSNGCSSNSTIDIDVDAAPNVNVGVISNTICVGDSITFDASSSSDVNNFNWTFQGGSPLSATTPLVTVVYSNPGVFSAKLSADNSCFTDTSYVETITVGCSSGIENAKLKNASVKYNLIEKSLSVQFHDPKDGVLSLVNSLGEVVVSKRVYNSSSQLIMFSCAEFAKGIYFLEFKGKEAVESYKVFIQ